MDASAWEHHSPIEGSGYSEQFAAFPTNDVVTAEAPARGERVGSSRVICRTYALQAIAVVALILTLWQIVASGQSSFHHNYPQPALVPARFGP